MRLALIHRLLKEKRTQSLRTSRRELLQAGLAAAAGLLSGPSPSLAAQRPTAGRKVIVVGAGFAGLACAYELRSVGYDVHVFEARSRVGGRVWSLPDLIAGKVVEGGGELLGSNQPTVLAYAAKFGLSFLDVLDYDDAEPEPTIVDGRKLSAGEVEKLTLEVDSAFGLLTELARPIDEEQPWKSPNARALDQRSTSEWISRLEVSELVKQLLGLQLTADNGVHVERQSLLGNLSQVKGGGLEKYWTDTEVYRLRGGNQQFATKLAESIGPDRLSLKNPVTAITVGRDSVTVTDSVGERHTADEVVLAVPPPVWAKIEINPPLPASLRPQMGSSVKYLTVVKRRFWKDNNLPPTASADGAISYVWEGTENQGGTDGDPAALVAYTGGPQAEANHQRTPQARQEEYLKAFEQLYPGFTAQFMKGRFINWLADPWTRAGYSFPAPGEVTTMGPVLYSGLGRLHFAGEHTCYRFVGYMEGGLNSGASLAKRLATREGIKAAR